jgi:hypothetical protein
VTDDRHDRGSARPGSAHRDQRPPPSQRVGGRHHSRQPAASVTLVGSKDDDLASRAAAASSGRTRVSTNAKRDASSQTANARTISVP